MGKGGIQNIAMSILVDENTRLIVQGITGKEGSFHAQKCLEYGTKVVAGVTPGKGGSSILNVPIYNTVESAVKQEGANTSLIFVPAPYAAETIMEASDAGISLVVCITEGIPVLDMVRVHRYLKLKGSRLIGPNCPGVISPGKSKVGIMVGEIHSKGPIGVVSRSGTLTYEAVSQLTSVGLGQSTCVGIGGDPLPGSTFVDILGLFQEDQETQAVVLIGEIGGTLEQEAASFIKRGGFKKPLFAFMAGSNAPSGKRMGHAGAIISGSANTAQEKIEALAAAGAHIIKDPSEIGSTVREFIIKY